MNSEEDDDDLIHRIKEGGEGLRQDDVDLLKFVKEEWRKLNVGLDKIKGKVDDFMRNRHVIEKTQNDEVGELVDESRRLRALLETSDRDKKKLLQIGEEHAQDLISLTSQMNDAKKQNEKEVARLIASSEEEKEKLRRSAEEEKERLVKLAEEEKERLIKAFHAEKETLIKE